MKQAMQFADTIDNGGFVANIYNEDVLSPTLTDAYHFSTPYAYWREGRAENKAVFYMFGRKEGLDGGYTIAGGLEGVIDIVKRWQKSGFTEDDVKFLRSQKTPSGKQKYPDEFIEYIKNMKFNLKIDAAPEGTAFFPQEPVLRVEGPMVQVKMLESVALGVMNGHSAYMTQAARQRDVVEKEHENGSPIGKTNIQGLRRSSIGAAIESSRSLQAGGYTNTSTGAAAQLFGQGFAGTMDHAWIMTHTKEISDVPLKDLIKLEDEGKIDELRAALKDDAFRSYSMAHPEAGILLVDTYNPIQGLENAITVIKELRELGLGQHYGVRFDSGDLVEYSKIALRRFAEEGFVEGLSKEQVKDMSDAELLKYSDKCSVFCAAADGIDEHSTQEMRENGAFYKSWGIGTAGAHVPPVGLVYKASYVCLDDPLTNQEENMTHVMKVAEHAPIKSSNPGVINSRRFYDEQGKLAYVVVYDEKLGLDAEGTAVNLRDFSDKKVGLTNKDGQDLLVPVFNEKGEYVYNEPPKIESFPGSGKLVTDLDFISARVKQQLATLSEGVRRIVRPRKDLIKDTLLQLFNHADKAGDASFNVDIEAIKAALPPEVEHVPVYLDNNLFKQRQACEMKHLSHSNDNGVGDYHERFEHEVPDASIEGDIKVSGHDKGMAA